MKTYISFLVIALLMINALNGQVKIGDSPENLHNASVLELESTSRVLVITRVTDAQMNLISPLRGAVVYNTDHDCLHYYDGNAWINICEALDNSFTVSTRADYMKPLNPNALDNTVIVTETTNPDGSSNYNFEVSQITGANIAPSAINGDKIQNGTVGSQDLAPKSVALGHFQDGGAVGDLFRWNGSQWVLSNESEISITESQNLADVVTLDPSAGNQQIKDLQDPTDLQDAATKDYVDTEILASNQTIVSGDADNSITASVTDGGAFYDDSAIQSDIVSNTTNITTNQTNIAQNSVDIATNTTAITTNQTNIAQNTAGIADNATNIAANTTTIGRKEDAANKSSDVTLSDGTNTLFPTELAVKTYVDNQIAASNQIIVSGDANNSITVSVTDGGAFYDDSAIQTDVTDNATNIAANTTTIGTKEDAANKSSDVTLSDGTNTLFPTELAVKTYVDNQITASNQTIVSNDANNSITASVTDGGAFYDDSAIQTATSEIVSGTAGSVFFSDGSGGLLQDNPNLFWNNTNKRLGIGTNAPTSTLQTEESFATAILRWNGGLLDLDETHHTVIITANSDINFPLPNTCQGRIYIIKNPSFIVTTDGYTNLMGSSSFDIPIQTTITIQSDGLEWQQIN